MAGRTLILAHGWRLECPRGELESLVREWVRPAVRAVPRAIASRLGPCRFLLRDRFSNPELSALWVLSEDRLAVELATEGFEPHDVAMECLLCLGEALWQRVRRLKRDRWLELLRVEIDAGVNGDIDEDARSAKRRLLLSPASARNPLRLKRYASISFAGTAAEYVHCLWHDVSARAEAGHLPTEWLRRRLELFARWFPPDRGYRLFARARKRASDAHA